MQDPKLTLHTLRERARNMRTNPTGAERKLWCALRRKQCAETKFRRQHIIFPFIVDFYSAGLKLVIEVDGTSHMCDARRARDAAREHYLQQKGCTVVRYTDDDVFTHLPEVLDHLYKTIMRLRAE